MRHISYSSIGESLMPEEFGSILSLSRARNIERGISGAIAFDGHMITQILEGPGEVVDRLFMTIRADKRHSGVVLLTRADITEYNFSSFAMAHMAPADLFLRSSALVERLGTGDLSRTPLEDGSY